jgi:hypothetical protein
MDEYKRAERLASLAVGALITAREAFEADEITLGIKMLQTAAECIEKAIKLEQGDE